MDRVYKLLQGLRPDFEGIKSQLCSRENSVTFGDTVSQLFSEESLLQEMKGGEDSSACAVTQPRASAATQSGQPTPQINGNKKGPVRDKESLCCNYCKRRGHVKETCWKLQGWPPQVHMMAQPCLSQGGMPGGQQWVPNYTSHSSGVQPSACSSTQVTSHHPQYMKIQSRQHQIQSLQQQIQSLQASSRTSTSSGSVIGSTSLANSGKNPILSALSSISSSNSHQSSWILDSGATDHMTPILDKFVSYESCTAGLNVQTANGTLFVVVGIGSIHVEPRGLLSRVLHVPKLFISLVSVQRIAKLEV